MSRVASSAAAEAAPFRQDVSGVMAEAVGAGGLGADEFAAWLARTQPGLDRLRAQHASGALPLLRLPEETADLDAMHALAAHLSRDATDVVVLGIGGSSLGAKALGQVAFDATPAHAWPEGRPRVHFLENLDPFSFERALAALDLATTRFLLVSKSGGTAEPLVQALAAKAAIEDAGGSAHLAAHFAAITEPTNNPVRRLATAMGAPVIDHHTGVGGRFSALTNVGLVPAILMGLDPAAVRCGAGEALAPVLEAASPDAVPAAAGAAMQVALAREKDARASVILAYSDRLERFGLWYRQLWAESLGKEGQGTLPATGIGPVDQHSQLQLYLAGPADKAYTVMHVASAGEGPRVSSGDPALAYLDGRTMGDLMDAEYRATVETLKNAGRPVRTIALPRLDERAMGALMMHFMLETILAAGLMGIDPFDQPAVEEGKVLARDYLGRMG